MKQIQLFNNVNIAVLSIIKQIQFSSLVLQSSSITENIQFTSMLQTSNMRLELHSNAALQNPIV